GTRRTLHPHAFAYSGLRWHCRAFDETHGEFRDFHLSRLVAIELGNVSNIDPKRDQDWHNVINLILKPNPALTPAERELVKADYSIAGGQLTFPVRACMAQYVLQSFQVDV